MEASNQEIIDLLEQNEKWWQDAADSCEHRAAILPSVEKEVQLLLAAVYRERAERHTQTLVRVRQGRKTAHN
jgi:hypothetical protein